MENIKATLPGIGEVTVVWFLATNKETRAVFIMRDGRVGTAPLENFKDVRAAPRKDGLLWVGAEDA